MTATLKNRRWEGIYVVKIPHGEFELFKVLFNIRRAYIIFVSKVRFLTINAKSNILQRDHKFSPEILRINRFFDLCFEFRPVKAMFSSPLLTLPLAPFTTVEKIKPL